MPLLIVGGRSFYAVAAVAGKARTPSVVRRVDGTTSDQLLLLVQMVMS